MAARAIIAAATVIGAGAGAVWLGPWNGRVALEQRATGAYHAAYVAAAWPPVALVSNLHGLHEAGGLAGVLKAHHVVEGISWAAWSHEPVESRWARLHDGNPVHRVIRQLVVAEVVLPALALLYLFVMFTVNRSLGRLRPGTGHGSARWATRWELWRMRPRGKASLVLGTVGRQRAALREHEVFEHVLVVGPPGSGKSSGLIIPNILRETGTHSLVIVDPKTELVDRTYAALSRHYDPWIVNFLDPNVSRAYNPLAHIADYLAAEAFAECWITNTGRSSSEPFWDNASKQLIVAAVLHLNATLASHGGATLTHLASFLTSLDLARVRRAFRDSPVPEARACASGFLSHMAQNEKLAGSIFTELPPRFSIINDPRVQATTSRDEVDFAALADPRHRPVALYLAVERTLAPLLKPLSACFFMQMFNTLIRVADSAPERVLPRPVVGYLDEFGNLGQIPDMPRWMSTVRSARMGFVVAVQDMDQISLLYGREGRHIIVTACGTRVALSRTSAEDAEWFSKQTGQSTVLTANAGDSRKRGRALADRGSRGYSETGRPLLTAGEVTRMAETEMLVLAGNRQPFKVQQLRWYQDGHTRWLGQRRLAGRRPVPAGGPPRMEPLAPPAPPLWDAAAAVTSPVAPGGQPTGAELTPEATSAALVSAGAQQTTWRRALETEPARPSRQTRQARQGTRSRAPATELGVPADHHESAPADQVTEDAGERPQSPARTAGSQWLPSDL